MFQTPWSSKEVSKDGRVMRFEPVALTNELVEQATASNVAFLVDEVYTGAPLVITFGFVSWDNKPGFDFYGRLKKLEATSGQPLNRIMVRDCQNGWYHWEIPGLGQHVDEVAANLKSMIEAIQPSKVITIGQSMGGYAAIMFGTLLQADLILSFGALSFLCPKEALTYHDRRWLGVMMDLEQIPPPVRYMDLPALCREMGETSEMHLFFGTKPDENTTDSVNLDVLHAFRYAPLRNCSLHPYPESGHAVVKYLIDTKRIDDLLGQYILGLEPAPEAVDTPVSAEWLDWIKGNLASGVHPEHLMSILRQNGFSEYQGRAGLHTCMAGRW